MVFEMSAFDVELMTVHMRDTSSLKLKLPAKVFHVHSFVALFS